MTLPLDLNLPLDETLETLRAIRNGEVDAVVVRGTDGDCIYTLRQIEPPYRAMVEQMAEGVLVLSDQGKVNYANTAFVKMSGNRRDISGHAVEEVFEAKYLPALESALHEHSRFEAKLGQTPVSVSVKQVPHETGSVLCLVFTDLTTHVERAKQIAALTSELTIVEQRERQRLAHTLHDHLQQLIVGVRMQLAMSRAEGEGEQAIDRAFTLLNEAQQACRDLTMDLSPPVLHSGDAAAALQWLASQMQRKHGLEVAVECTADVADMPEATRVVMFLAGRELMFNVVKHAGVSKATAHLSRADGMFILDVVDQGKGIRGAAVAADASGFGLLNLRERVKLLGGELFLDSAPGCGTRARVSLPCSS